jgi:hypothetical protein
MAFLQNITFPNFVAKMTFLNHIPKKYKFKNTILNQFCVYTGVSLVQQESSSDPKIARNYSFISLFCVFLPKCSFSPKKQTRF